MGLDPEVWKTVDTFGHKGVVQGVVEYTDHVKSENFLVALVFPISYSNIQVEVVAFVVIHKEVLRESSITVSRWRCWK